MLTVHGEVNATHAHLIDECATAEIHARVCQWLLRSRLSKMKASDIIKCSEQILRSKTVRNKALMQLKIDAPPPDPWHTIDALPSKRATPNE